MAEHDGFFHRRLTSMRSWGASFRGTQLKRTASLALAMMLFSAFGVGTLSSAAAEEVDLATRVADLEAYINNGGPKALNALNQGMVEALRRVYAAWGAPGSGVGLVVTRGAGGKAYCAGGDVKSVRAAQCCRTACRHCAPPAASAHIPPPRRTRAPRRSC